MKKRIKNIVDNPNTFGGKFFAFFIQLLIVVSLISFSISTLPNISISTQMILDNVEMLIVAIFSIEYLLRIFVSEKKIKFLFSFYGIIDLLAILPFYLATSVDLRSVRIFRLLRLFRIFKLLRYSRAINRFHRAFLIAKEELILFTSVALMVLYLAAVGIYYFEHEVQPEQFSSVLHSLWWAVATLTTVGYGDVYPITAGGKIFTFIILMIGLGIVAVPTGLVSSALSQARLEEKELDKDEV